MRRLIKEKSIYLGKLAIGFALVGWILWQVEPAHFSEYFAQLRFWPLAAVLLLSVTGLLVQFRRWKFLIENNSSHYQLKDLLPSFFAGFAFRLMVPGGHAEVSKILLLPGKKRGKAVAFGMEKFFQTFIKIVLITAAIPLTFPEYRWLSISLLVFYTAVYIFLPYLPWWNHFQEKQVNNHAIFAKTLLFSVAVFLVMALQYYILLNQSGKIALPETLQTVVYMWGAGLVPISISGLGVREGLAVYFLKMYDIPAAHAVATSLFLFTVNAVVPALIGAVVIYRKRAHLKDMKDTVRSTRELFSEIKNKRRKTPAES